MGLMSLTAAAFASMMRMLLPPGRIWRKDGAVDDALLACGDELERVVGRGADLIEEADPQTTSELLADFERVLGLSSDGTDAERRARVVAHLIKRQRVRPADYQLILAPILGLDPEDVEIREISRADAVAMADDTQIFRFHVFRDPGLGGTYDIEAAQAVVDAMSHAHVKGYVIEELGMVCDEPTSLCDRDLLGA
jgi:uncharacterized protein YmfQ (DUF2313 family)